MSVIQLPRASNDPSAADDDVDVEIVIPVYNEEEQLAVSVRTLRRYLDASFPFTTTVTIVDNASTDSTWRIAADLAADVPGIQAVHLDRKGRGLALRTAWSQSRAAVVAYMDVDLATGLDALLPLVAPLLSGHSDVAIGSRLAPGAHVVRGTKREFISRGYNLLLRGALRSACTDAQCGFKAMRREIALELLPLVEDDQWFFDTEVLVTAQRIGLRIHEVPVDWVDDTDSRVDVVHTALDDLRGVARLLGPSARRPGRRRVAPPSDARLSDPSHPDVTRVHPGPAGSAGARRSGGSHLAAWSPAAADQAQPRLVAAEGTPLSNQVFSDELLRFAGVGVVSTLAYAGLFAALEPSLGSYVANTVAVGLCSLGNTAAHRGMADTVGHGLDSRRRLLVAGGLLGVSLSFSTAALAATRALGLSSLAPELCAVTVAGVGAAIIRYDILRSWVFRPEFGTHLADPTDGPTSVPAPAPA